MKKQLHFWAKRLFIFGLFFLAFSMTAFGQPPTGDESNFLQKIADFIAKNGWLIVLAWEFVTKAVPGWESIGILKIIGYLIDTFIPSQKGAVRYQTINGQAPVNSQGLSDLDFGKWITMVLPFLIGLLICWFILAKGFSWIFCIFILLMAFIIQRGLIANSLKR